MVFGSNIDDVRKAYGEPTSTYVGEKIKPTSLSFEVLTYEENKKTVEISFKDGKLFEYSIRTKES